MTLGGRGGPQSIVRGSSQQFVNIDSFSELEACKRDDKTFHQKCTSRCPGPLLSKRLPWLTKAPEALRISHAPGAKKPPVINTLPVDSTTAPAAPRESSNEPVETKLPFPSRISQVPGAPGGAVFVEPKMNTLPFVRRTALAPLLNAFVIIPVFTNVPVCVYISYVDVEPFPHIRMTLLLARTSVLAPIRADWRLP